MSSTTTYTMAPAAKASAYGRIGTIMATRAAPRRPAMGSTRPDSCPYQMAFAVEQPAALRGKDTAYHAFWEVLDANTKGKISCGLKSCRLCATNSSEADTNSKTLRYVVHSDSNYKKEDSSPMFLFPFSLLNF